MHPEEIQRRIEGGLPTARVAIRDLTGTSDHWEVTVVSKAFEGKPLLEQHRLIQRIFEVEIASGELHALSLKTYTPEQWTKVGEKR